MRGIFLHFFALSRFLLLQFYPFCTLCTLCTFAFPAICDSASLRARREERARGFDGLTSLYYQPEGANHSDTQLIGIDCAVKLVLTGTAPVSGTDDGGQSVSS